MLPSLLVLVHNLVAYYLVDQKIKEKGYNKNRSEIIEMIAKVTTWVSLLESKSKHYPSSNIWL